ncbi:MAG: GLPGLI family protein [Bacteroidota bacterium]
MKQFFTFFLLALPLTILAQNNEGVITYEQVIKIKIDKSQIPEGMGDMAKLIPKEQRYQKRLVFSPDATLYTAIESEEAETEIAGPGGRMRVWMERADDVTYADLKKNRLVEQKDFFGRTFLVKDDMEKLKWKMTGQTKEILGHVCLEATSRLDTIPMTAWFAQTIPVASGPETAGGQLPGMVLELTMRDGMVTYTATNLEFRKVKKGELAEPKKGKEVTREEFREIARKKMEEMREQWGGRGGRGPRMMIAR